MKKVLLFIVMAIAVAYLVSCSTSPIGYEVSEDGILVLYENAPVQKVEVALGPAKSISKTGLGEIYSFDAFDLEIKTLEHGVAFRYKGTAPQTTYVIPEGITRWASFVRNGNDYESLFPKTTSSTPGKWAYPVLVEYSDGLFGFIAEAGIERGMTTSHLETASSDGKYTVSPIAPQQRHEYSPWRFVEVGSLADVVENSMVEQLSPDCAIEDTSWIKPGLSSWVYWAYNHGSKDFQIVKQYIDLAAEMHWPYCLIDWEWDEMANGGTIDDALAYARQKNVKINLWYNSGTSWIGPGAPGPLDRLLTAQSREAEMSRLEELGVTGIKVDFFAEDDPDIIEYYLDILECAAKHHLLVDFHGCTIPRGWQKTYPNMVSMEAVYGAEWYNNFTLLTGVAASHNATLPFTRNLMGPMDYTPGTFSDTQHPHITTYAHELALPVLFQSKIQHMPDSPETYRSLPEQVKDILSTLPTVWDETRLLDGYPGPHFVSERRSGDVWYIAGINGTEEELTIPIGSIAPKGAGILVSDGDADREFSIQRFTSVPENVVCRPRGGFCIRMSSGDVKTAKASVSISTDKGSLEIRPMLGNSVRVSMTNENAPALDELYYLPSSSKVKFSVKEDADKVSIVQDEITTVYDRVSSTLSFYDKDGNKILSENGRRSIWNSSAQGEDCVGALQSFDSPEDEFLFGLGQFQDGYLNVKGLSRRLTQVNTQISIPFIMSNKGYGLLWNSYSLTDFNPCDNHVALSSSGIDGKSFIVNATGTSGNNAERRQYDSFYADIQLDEDADYAFLLDVGQSMGRKHYVSIDEDVIMDCNNLWLPPTTSFITNLKGGSHRIEVRGVKGDKPVLYWRKVDNTTTFQSPVGKGVDYTVFAGNADKVVASYRKATGEVPEIPEWALGYVHCRERFSTQAELLENATTFKNEGIPVDVIVQDWQWWGSTGWNSMQFDPELYPDPKAMIDSLHSMDMRLMLSVWSKVDKDSALGQIIDQKGYYIPGTDWIDFFRGDAAQFYWQNFRDRLVRPFGIDSWWLDATEPENDDLVGRRIGDDNLPGEFYRNVYPLKVVSTVYDGLKAEDKDASPLILTRSMAAGIQRYGAVTWSGDVGNDYETLRRQIAGGLSLMACGIPWWTYDAGGFFRPFDQYTSEEYQARMIRWIQNSVFLPVMRVHGYMSQTEPWRYFEKTDELYRKAIQKRYELLPYIKEYAKKVSTENYTLMRPLVFDFPSDTEALKQNTEFMFGPDYLVCPVVSDIKGEMKVYLPQNTNGWTDCISGQKYTGGQYVTVTLSEEGIPFFKKN